MNSFKSYLTKLTIVAILLSGLVSCVEKDIDPADPAAAFVRAREPYDNEMFEMAILKLGEFKSRFPYSKHAPDAELMIADAQFQLSKYPEAAASYELFVKMHPKHEKADFAQFRVGEAYWAEAPEDVDREQEFTLKAIAEWEKLTTNFPSSEETKKAEPLLMKGRRRVAEHLDFIAKFYCKQKIFHACAFRYIELAEKYPQFPDLAKNAYLRAATALDVLAETKAKDDQNDSNLYFKAFSPSQLKDKAKDLRALAGKLNT